MYGRTGEKSRIPLKSCSRMHFLYPISPERTQRSHINYARQLARRAREKHKMKVFIRNNRLCMVESGMSYGVSEILLFLSEG